MNGCAQCICIDGRVNCDESKCQIFVDPPESSTVPVVQPKYPTVHQPPQPPAAAATTTTTTKAPIVQTRGSEKGPELGYYANRLTDVNMNSEKGPSEPMQYMPEQYQYLQAQVGVPGLRGPQGKNIKDTIKSGKNCLSYNAVK